MALSDAQIKKLQRDLVKAQAKIAKFNSPAQQVQRGKESMTRNPQALKMKTWDQMTPSQRDSALAKEAKKAAANRAKFNKFNSPAQQAQRAKESMTRNPQALKMKTWDQMTPSQRSSALAKEAKKGEANLAKFNKEANKKGAANKLKAQGAKMNKTPVDGYFRRGKK